MLLACLWTAHTVSFLGKGQCRVPFTVLFYVLSWTRDSGVCHLLCCFTFFPGQGTVAFAIYCAVLRSFLDKGQWRVSFTVLFYVLYWTRDSGVSFTVLFYVTERF